MKASIAFSALIFCFKADCIRSENNAVVRSVNQHVLLQVKTNVLLQIDNSISHGEHIDSNSIPLQWVLQVDELRFDSTSLGASEDSIRLDERILDVQWQDGGAGTAAYSLLLPLENSTRRSNRPLLIAIWERDLETKSRRFLSQHLTHVPRTAPLPGIPSDQDYSWKPNTVVEMNIKSRYSSIDTRSSKNYETGSSTNYGFWAFVVASVYGLFYLRRDTRAMLVSRRSTDENVELDNECEEAENSNDEADEEMSLNADSNDRDDDERSLSPAFVLLRSSAITSDESDEEEEEDLNLERPPSMERHLIKSFLEKGFPFEDALEKATEKYLMEKNSRTENPVPPVNERTHPLEYNDVLRATPDGASGMNTTSCESVGAPDTLRVCPTMSNPKCSDVPDAGDASGSSRIMQKMLKEASSGEGVCQEIRVNDVKRSPGTIREGVINVETSGGEPMSLVESKNSPATVALASKPRKKRPRTLISSERKNVLSRTAFTHASGRNLNVEVTGISFADKACKRAKSAPSDEEYGGYQSEPIARAKIYCHSDAEDDARVVAEASSMASAGLFEHTQDETTHDNATGKGSTSASLDSGVQENTACEEEDGVSPSSLVVIGPLNVTLTEATRCQALDERSANESADDPQKVIKSSSFSIAAAVPLENCTRPTDSDSLDEDPAQDDKEDEKEHLLLAPAGPLQLDQTEAAHSDILDKDSPDASLESGVQDDAVYGDGFVVIPPSMAAIELHKEGRTEATRSDSSGNVSAPALFDKDQDDTTDSCLASGNELYTLQSADDKTNEMQSTTHQPRTCLVDKPQARFSAPDPPSVRVDQVERTPRASDDESDKLSDAERTFYIPDKISAVQSKAPCSALLGAEPVHVDQVVSALPAEDRVLPDSPYVSTLPPDSCSSYSDSSVDTVRSNGRVEYAKVMLEKSAELKSVAGDDILAEFVPSAALRTAAMAMRDFSFEFEGKGSRAKPLTLKELNDNKKPKRSTRARSDSFGPSKSQAVATRQARTDRGPSHFVSPNPTVQGLMDVTGDNTPALKNLMSPPTTKPLRPKTTDPSTLQTFKVDASKKRRITFDGKPVELSKKMKHVPSDEAFDYKDDAEDPFADKDEFPRPEATRPPTIR